MNHRSIRLRYVFKQLIIQKYGHLDGCHSQVTTRREAVKAHLAEVEVQQLRACLNLESALPRSKVIKRGEMIATDEADTADKILVQHLKKFQNLVYLLGNFFRYHDAYILIPFILQ